MEFLVANDFSVLLIGFNRPDLTIRVFEAVRRVRPIRLFFAVDGPRPDRLGEGERVKEVREVIERVDWPCEVRSKFSEINQGCRLGVSSAISWFFDYVSEGIILEDDCVPDPSFFFFCQTLLKRYRDNPQIGHIGGFNVQDGHQRGAHSYYFSRYFHVWGWATWRRAWSDFDVAGADYERFKQEKVLEALMESPVIAEFWEHNFDSVFMGNLDTWDYQWVYTNFKLNRYAIIPNVNLVSNIGFGDNATHTIDSNHPVGKITSGNIEVDDGPMFVVPNREADRYTYLTHLELDLFPLPEKGHSWFKRTKNKTKSILKKLLRSNFR